MAVDFLESVPAAPITPCSDVAVRELPSVRLILSALFHSNSIAVQDGFGDFETMAELIFRSVALARCENA